MHSRAAHALSVCAARECGGHHAYLWAQIWRGPAVPPPAKGAPGSQKGILKCMHVDMCMCVGAVETVPAYLRMCFCSISTGARSDSEIIISEKVICNSIEVRGRQVRKATRDCRWSR